jgi:importin-5
MSVLPPDVHPALAQLLQGLQSSDNVVRVNAEEELQAGWVQSRPEILMMGLVEQILGSEDTGVSCSCSRCCCCGWGWTENAFAY